MTSVVVTRAGDDETATLAALRYRWRVEEAGERAGDASEFEARFLQWYDAHRGTHHGYLALDDGAAIGCAWLCVINRIPGPERFVRRGGILQSVYVEPAHRNRGIGEQLIGRIVDDARALNLDYLMVHPSARAFSFYRRLGFDKSEKLLELRLG